MKKILALILTLIKISSIFGQNYSIGTEVGFISSINSDYKLSELKNRRNTYYSGINLNYKYNERISFSTGVQYLKQGYRHSTCYTFEEGVKNQLAGKIDYLTIPISVNVHFLKSKKLVTTFGILGAYNIKAVQVYPEPIGGCEIYYSPDIAAYTQDYSMIGLIGIAYKIFKNNKFELVSNIKYYQGITNTFNNPHSDIHLNIDRKYSSILTAIHFNYTL